MEQLEAVKAAGGAAEEAQAQLEEHAREAAEAAAEREALQARVEAAELTAQVAVRCFSFSVCRLRFVVFVVFVVHRCITGGR